MIHELKTRHEYFEDILKGQKTFEIRKNDRPFAVGDFLALNERAAPEPIPAAAVSLELPISCGKRNL